MFRCVVLCRFNNILFPKFWDVLPNFFILLIFQVNSENFLFNYLVLIVLKPGLISQRFLNLFARKYPNLGAFQQHDAVLLHSAESWNTFVVTSVLPLTEKYCFICEDLTKHLQEESEQQKPYTTNYANVNSNKIVFLRLHWIILYWEAKSSVPGFALSFRTNFFYDH